MFDQLGPADGLPGTADNLFVSGPSVFGFIPGVNNSLGLFNFILLILSFSSSCYKLRVPRILRNNELRHFWIVWLIFHKKNYMGGLKLIFPLVSLFQIREILILARKILKMTHRTCQIRNWFCIELKVHWIQNDRIKISSIKIKSSKFSLYLFEITRITRRDI